MAKGGNREAMRRAINPTGGKFTGPDFPLSRPSVHNFDARGLVVFSSPITTFVKFDDKLLVQLEDGTMYLSTDGTTWSEFDFRMKEEDLDA